MARLPSLCRKLHFHLIPKSKMLGIIFIIFWIVCSRTSFALIQKCFKAIFLSGITLYRLGFTRSSALSHYRIEVLIKHIQNGDNLSYIDRPKIFSIPTPIKTMWSVQTLDTPHFYSSLYTYTISTNCTPHS